MRHGREDDDAEVAGQDSFLDVVANIVGILILLVMVVGLRVSRDAHNPNDATAVRAPAVTNEQLREAVKETQELRSRAVAAVEKVNRSRRELLQLDDERVGVAAFVAESKEALEQKKRALSVDQRRDVELRTKLLTAQAELEDLARRQVTMAAYTPQVESIESLPTPLAQTVEGEEVHIRLAGGKAAIFPLAELLEEAKESAQSNVWRLESRDQATISVGPIDGFRLQYSIGKHSFTSRTGATGTIIGVNYYRLVPDDVAGYAVPVDEAVLPESRLMRQITSRPASTTVTVWTYPDSFDGFRKLKRKLYDLGYPTAARPMPEGVPIFGSASGSRSDAQ